MSRSFGPVVIVDPKTNEISKVHCGWCIFNDFRDGGRACSHVNRANPRKIDDPGNTPEWCEMRAGNVQDTLDMVNDVRHYVYRWSGRKTDEPRKIYDGIPSEAARQFRLASRDAKRGTVQLEDAFGKVLDQWRQAAS
jgi:hypothetical protein